jgi:hypothetical protein
MRALLQLLLELSWPNRMTAGRHSSRKIHLRALAILMIALVAGPDICAAIELSTLLEVLGAAMFLLSFAIGFKLFGIAVFEQLRTLLLPAQYVALARVRGHAAARVHGALLICRHNLPLCALIISAIAEFLQFAR